MQSHPALTSANPIMRFSSKANSPASHADKKDIMIERLGSRTLQIRSSVARFDLRAEWSSAWMIPMEKGREEEPAMNDEEEAQRHANKQDNEGSVTELDGEKRTQRHHHHGPARDDDRKTRREVEEGEEGDLRNGRGREEKQSGEDVQAMLLERRVGNLQRSFTFPCAVDIDSLKARLRCGLLVIMVPKLSGEKRESKRIDIED
jgi:hypothetical protein